MTWEVVRPQIWDEDEQRSCDRVPLPLDTDGLPRVCACRRREYCGIGPEGQAAYCLYGMLP